MSLVRVPRRPHFPGLQRAVLGMLIVLTMGLFSPATSFAAYYGVIFSGGWDQYNNHDRYYNQTLRMWNTMTGTLGYDNVYVLFADGTDPAVDRSTGVNSDWSMIPSGHILAATDANFQSLLTTLAGTITSADDFAFWSFDHGSSSGALDAGSLCGWNHNLITDEEFGTLLAAVTAASEYYVLGQCFAGDLVRGLGHPGTEGLEVSSGETVFATWAADYYEYSWGDGFVDAWADGIDTGLRDTWELFTYALANDPYAGWDYEHPGAIGASFDIESNSVPEPVSLAMFFGLTGFGMVLARRKKR